MISRHRAGIATAFMLALAGEVAAQADRGGLEFVTYGPNPVGYRFTVHQDASRSAGPATNWLGKPTGAPGRTPMQVSVWYPAGAGGRNLTIGDYALQSNPLTRENPSQAREAVRQQIAGSGELWRGQPLTAAETDSTFDRPLRATRDATPRPGRHPVVVGGMGHGMGAPLAEYLASHGYVVISAVTTGTAGMQVTRPQAALELHTRTFETAVGLVYDMPFADTTRIAVLGVNFDGMAALIYQMRNMRAAAVISIDGWEGKGAGSGTLTSSMWFDRRRMRVPYLAFMQADPPAPQYAADPTILDHLPYAPRAMYVLPGLTHIHLVGGVAASPLLGPTERSSFRAEFETVRAFLDRHLRQSTAGGAPPAVVGEPVAVLSDARPALPPVPDGAEFEELVMTGDVERVQRVVRDALARDPTVRLFDPQTMNLFAFRFRQHRKQPEVAMALLRLAAEALPGSSMARIFLGNAYEEDGRAAEAKAEFRRALELLDADSDVAADEKARLRPELEHSAGP